MNVNDLYSKLSKRFFTFYGLMLIGLVMFLVGSLGKVILKLLEVI